MSRLSVNINSDDSISTGDQGVEKGDLAVTFDFVVKRDVFFSNDTKTIINAPFPNFLGELLELDKHKKSGIPK